LNIEENEQQENLHEVNRELGNPPDTSSPEGLIKEEGASQGYESSSEESVEEENNLVGRDTDKSMEEDENGTRVAPLELKPPYYHEKTLVSSLSAISNLGTLS
jgi:IMP dehydrogenase/GMP reductase